MRAPAVNLAGNLMWTRSGTVWATWRLDPRELPYAFATAKQKRSVRSVHMMLFRALRGEALLLGVNVGSSPAAVVERMTAGVNLEFASEWGDECAETLDSLADLPLGRRIHILSVPLRRNGRWTPMLETTRVAHTQLSELLGVPPRGVPDKVVAAYAAEALAVQKAIPAVLYPTPITPAQMIWLHGHAQTRGLYLDEDLPPAAPPRLGNDRELVPWRVVNAAALPTAVLHEGGMPDEERSKASLRQRNPLARRYLKVTSLDGESVSYQAMAALSGVPADGAVFPGAGAEFLGRIDEAGIDVDYAVRLNIRSSSEVAARNRKAVRELNDQFDQRADEISTGPHALIRRAEDMADYQAQLEKDSDEVEVSSTTIFAVGAPHPEIATDCADVLSGHFKAHKYQLARQPGEQQALWWAMYPGTPAGRITRTYAQFTTSHAFSTSVPVVATEIGAADGPLLALNISSGPLLADGMPCGNADVVHYNPAASASKRDQSGSIAVCGEKGAGKSHTLMKIATETVDRGGRIVAIDRTASGEWVRMADAVPESTVVDVAQPIVSVDPLRVFGALAGARAAKSFLTPLLNVAPTSQQGVLLSETLTPDYLHSHQITSLGDLVAHLNRSCELPGARELGRIMNVYARLDLGRSIFDGSLPPLPLTDRAIVFWTHGLALPERQELELEHLFAQMSVEKTFGRAMYALIANIARYICFSDRSDLAGFFCDETHHLVSSPEGLQELTVFARDDRKHAAFMCLGSHAALHDFGDETLRGLIPNRILMRHRDHTLAKQALQWLDLDPNDDELVDLITSDTSPVDPATDEVPSHRRGEGLMRDELGRVGRIKVLQPARAHRREAINTTPDIGQRRPLAEVQRA